MPPTLTNWLLEKGQVLRLRKAGYSAVRLGNAFHETPGAQAELALLRALSLEKELRRASLIRSRESVAALARGVVETALRGLYILADPDGASRRLEVETRGHLRKLSFLGDARLGGMLNELSLAFGEDLARGMPDLRQVAEAVDRHYDIQVFSEQRLGEYLYHDWYAPLSNFSVHSSGAALARYYRFRTEIIRKRPWGIVPRRGSIRVADASIAFLLAELLKSRDQDAAWLERYGRQQVQRANIPMVVVLAQVAIGQGPVLLMRTAIAAIRYREAFDENAPKQRRLDAMRAFQRIAIPGASDSEVNQMSESLLGAFDGSKRA